MFSNSSGCTVGSHLRCRLLPAACCVLLAACLSAQTTQGIIGGRVADSQTGKPLPDALVTYYNAVKNEFGDVRTDTLGHYALPFLSPGLYRVRAEKDGFQAREIRELSLPVAARLELNFPLRPLNAVLAFGSFGGVLLPGQDAILPQFGPDLKRGLSAPLQLLSTQANTLQPALSYVVDPNQIGEMPLATRNVYTMMVLLQGVTAESATGRGLGLSVNGQRSSAANFLLDGLEYNDDLNTGPFSPVAPEGMQEYRVSTNNFSAEFGRAPGFIANAVTRSGGNSFHGLGYSYLGNEILSANSSLNNARLLARPPYKQLYLGYSVGGPIIKDRWYFSTAFERFSSRSRTSNPEEFDLLIPQQIDRCLQSRGLTMAATTRSLFDRFPAPPLEPLATQVCSYDSMLGKYSTTRRVAVDRSLALIRSDYLPAGGTHRLMARASIGRVTQPEFVFSPYEGLRSPLTRHGDAIAVNYVRLFSRRLTNELRLGWRGGKIERTRPHSDVPMLQLFLRLPQGIGSIAMPGSAVEYDFTLKGHTWEVADSMVIVRGRHILTAGGGFLVRRPKSNFTYFRDGLYNFNDRNLLESDNGFANANSILNFALGQPKYFQAALSRERLQAGSGKFVQPAFDRSYANRQFYGFLQDSVKVSGRLGLSFGLRYESFGALKNTGVQDGYILLGSGGSVEERLAGASLVFDNSQHRSAYRPDRNNWAGRFGFSYDLLGDGKTVFRSAYGIFYDRPFDNLVINPRNNIEVGTLCLNPTVSGCSMEPFNYLRPTSEVLALPGLTRVSPVFPTNFNLNPKVLRTIEQRIARSDHPELFWVDENLRSPHVQSWFAAVQRQVTRTLYLEISHMGSQGRKLFTSDYVNRVWSRPGASNAGRFHATLPDILYRSNSGSSTYTALGVSAAYRSSRRGQLQLSYTLGHSIDNQSDALLGDVFNLNVTNPDAANSNLYSRELRVSRVTAAFTRQFDSGADRGNSDFDLRHNLVVGSIWYIPSPAGQGLLRRIFAGWQFAQLAGFRTGFPYTVNNPEDARLPPSGGVLINNRRSLKPQVKAELDEPIPIRGGFQLLNLDSLGDPAPGEIGNIGRNSFRGPGFWNVDISLAKSFAVKAFGEAGRLQFRADFFNVFNHANLSPPNEVGQSFFGPSGAEAAFPAVAPLVPSSRRVQLQVKLYF